MPQKTLYAHLKPTAGSPPMPKNQGSIGQPYVTHGTPLASHCWPTGMLTTGVMPAKMASGLSLVMSSPVTSAARLLSDWLSLTMKLDGMLLAVGADQPVADGFFGLGQQELVRLAEAGEHAGGHGDPAELDLAAHLDTGGRGGRGAGRSRGGARPWSWSRRPW